MTKYNITNPPIPRSILFFFMAPIAVPAPHKTKAINVHSSKASYPIKISPKKATPIKRAPNFSKPDALLQLLSKSKIVMTS